jgi:hypothetical protein|tara:strand:- start:55 stop:258 length:204 start_codon:yes stop_codon:yes gene_type:complete
MSNEPIVTYDAPLKGQTYIQETKKKIQNDVRSYLEVLYAYDEDKDEAEEMGDHLCKIVADNFKELEN